MHRRARLAIGLGIACLLAASGVQSRDYPEKPIRIIVPTSPGTTSDLLIRAMAPEMSRAIGQSLIIESRPGANQVIAYEYIARQAPADGYTVGIINVDGMAMLPVVTKDVRIDVFRELPSVIGLAEGRYVLRSPAGAPWKAFAEMVAYVKANPGKVNYGSSAPQVRFPILVLMRELGLDMLYVPYGGGAKYLQALIAGEIHLGITGEAAMAGAGERVRGLAVTGEQRSTAFREVPTFTELRFPQIKGPGYSLNVRAGTPADATEKIFAAASRTLQRPEVQAALAKLPLEVLNESAETTQRKLLDAGKFYAEFAKAADIRPE